MTPTSDQIQRLAPDAQVLAAGQKLGKPVQWLGLGRHGDAIWGECRGSALYRVCADTVEVGYSCSCPSRKHPCKHVVGLLTLWLEQEEAVADSTPPLWVTAWLTRRSTRTQRVEADPSSSAPPRTRTTPQAERRGEEREARMLDGIEALELWMCDLVRNGLATVETQPPAFWQHQAARLVDAGLPGLASWVRRLSIIPGSAPQWPERLLGELGRLELLIQSYRRIDQLDPLLQYDVRALVGQHLTKDQVSAEGEHVTDAWIALGALVEDDEQLRVQRTWLRGLRTGRSAMVLQFVVGKATTFPWVATINHVQEMELHFWPSAWPQRAFIARRLGEPVYSKDRRPGHATIEDMLAEVAQGLAVNPWIDRTCAVLRDVVPIRQGDDEWLIRDQSGASLPLQRQSHWRMFAQSGGYPIDVHGEWNGTLFHSFAFRIAETGT
jgi:SWIM zinc finger